MSHCSGLQESGLEFLATSCVNVRFRRRIAARTILRRQHFSCCERSQQKIIASAMGSFVPFAALGSNVR
jgi:hypothetical protein